MNDMSLPEPSTALVRTELWLTLAQAFRPPMEASAAQAVLELLADDLEDFAAEAGFEASEALQGIRAGVTSIADSQALLVLYSGLFLMPPTPARLNVGWYLDRTVNGPSLDGMDLWRERYGIAPRADFKDMPDHLAIQLEFIAYLSSYDGEDSLREYANGYLLPALPKIIAALDEAGAGNTLYRHLLRYTLDSLQPLATERIADPRQEGRKRRHDTDRGIWRHCVACGKPYAREKEIQIMTKALAQAGLPAEHLNCCPDCRDPLKGALPRINR